MKSSLDVRKDLAKNGYNWQPQYKEILTKVWSQMETYFDDDEEVMSALWSSFKRYDTEMMGIVFITSKRTFTLEVMDDQASNQCRYLPFDSFSLEKIQFQPSASKEGLNFVSLQSDSFGNGITFGTPNRQVAEHFIETLKGRTNGVIEVLPESDDPLLANNEREQVVDEEAPTAKENIDHKLEEKHEEEVPIQEQEMWRKAPAENYEKEVEIKIVPSKPPKPKKVKDGGYGSKFKSKLWLLWFLLPFGLILLACVFVFVF